MTQWKLVKQTRYIMMMRTQLSIDFNQLRPIPEAISPLNSPVRPVAKFLDTESASQVPLYNSHKGNTLYCLY